MPKETSEHRKTWTPWAIFCAVAWVLIATMCAGGLSGCAVARPCEVGVCGDAQAHEPARKSGEDSAGTFDVTIPAACRNKFLDELFGECEEWGE
jgi:hypothetical protein